MGKSTISMAIFNSKLLVYQAGYIFHVSRRLDAQKKCVCFPPVIRWIVAEVQHGPAPGTPLNSSCFWCTSLSTFQASLGGHPMWWVILFGATRLRKTSKRTRNLFRFPVIQGRAPSAQTSANGRNKNAHRRPCSKIFLKEHIFSWTLICAQMKLQVYKNPWFFMGAGWPCTWHFSSFRFMDQHEQWIVGPIVVTPILVGHNRGAATDQNAEVEERQKWPLEAPQLVRDFIQSVKTAAEKRQLLAILTGVVSQRNMLKYGFVWK